MVNNFTLFQALTHTHTLESRKRHQDITLTRASTLQVAEGDGGGSALRVSNSSAQRSSTSGRALLMRDVTERLKPAMWAYRGLW